MRVIIPGKSKKEERIEVCESCGCKFGFYDEEMLINNGISAVNCPTCGNVIVLGRTSSSTIPEFRKDKLNCHVQNILPQKASETESFKDKI